MRAGPLASIDRHLDATSIKGAKELAAEPRGGDPVLGCRSRHRVERAANELSDEVWRDPLELRDRGPASIVALSLIAARAQLVALARSPLSTAEAGGGRSRMPDKAAQRTGTQPAGSANTPSAAAGGERGCGGEPTGQPRVGLRSPGRVGRKRAAI
jgi:hypothetical protein